MMKKKYLKILLLIFVLGILGFQWAKSRSSAYAGGSLTIDWGVPSGEAIFVVNNFLPGEKVEREVTITNNTTNTQPIGVRGIKNSEKADLSRVLNFTISSNGTDLYGGSLGAKTLFQFFSESFSPDGIFLFNLNPGEAKKIKFLVKFLEGAGNEFQGGSLVFDLALGVSLQIPAECQNLRFDKIIYGSAGNDNLKGTNGNDLIFGFEGNDRINGSNNNDCLVGGGGNDILDGSNGNDVVLGGEGDDKIEGSNGDDLLFGGGGNDIIDASNGNDRIEGGEGNDEIRGRNGNDILLGQEGNDWLDGGLGVDICEGETKRNCER
jgi:Ca2+-binding RTX toxin-like protein